LQSLEHVLFGISVGFELFGEEVCLGLGLELVFLDEEILYFGGEVE
jgi:hypothetical protein